MIKRFVKRVFIVLLVLVTLLVAGTFIFLMSVHTSITEEALPQEVYMNEPTSIALATAIGQVVLADDEQKNQAIETFLNVMIFRTVRNDINPDYDPMREDEGESQYIIKESGFILDYVIANVLEDDIVKLTVSLKRSQFPFFSSAIYFYFDMALNPTTMSFKLTLNHVDIDKMTISHQIYDWLVSRIDKEAIQASVTVGELNLEDYTYTINFFDEMTPF